MAREFREITNFTMRYLYLFAAVLCAATAGGQTLTVPATANEGATVTITYDELPDALIRSEQVTIDFGDGTSLTTNAIGRTARLSIAHTYWEDSRGVPFTVRVTEDDFEAGPLDSTGQIVIRNVVPVITLPSSYTLPTGRLSASVSVTDPGNDEIRVQVDYGDGAFYDFGFAFMRGRSLNHVYYATGTYNLVVTVFDDDGDMARANASVHVTGTIPQPEIVIKNFAGLLVTGEVGQFYEIQKTDVMESTNWTFLTYLYLTNNPSLWIDLDTNSTKRFYRAIAR